MLPSQQKQQQPFPKHQLGPTVDEMASFYASFTSDDTLIEIIPSFDCTNPNIKTISSVSVGPFTAGMPTIVPLWMASYLHQHSLATIIAPQWLTISNLSSIIQYEKTNGSLFVDENAILYNKSNTYSSIDQPQTKVRLPLNYYEMTNRIMKLMVRTNNTSTAEVSGGFHNGSSVNAGAVTMNDNPDAIQLLVQDLFDIRMDKLRKQFQELSSSSATLLQKDLVVDVTGIGLQERAVLKQFVSNALTDYYFLNNTKTKDSTTTGTSKTDSTARRGIRNPVSLSNRTSRGTSSTGDHDNDGENVFGSNNDESIPETEIQTQTESFSLTESSSQQQPGAESVDDRESTTKFNENINDDGNDENNYRSHTEPDIRRPIRRFR